MVEVKNYQFSSVALIFEKSNMFVAAMSDKVTTSESRHAVRSVAYSRRRCLVKSDEDMVSNTHVYWLVRRKSGG